MCVCMYNTQVRAYICMAYILCTDVCARELIHRCVCVGVCMYTIHKYVLTYLWPIFVYRCVCEPMRARQYCAHARTTLDQDTC
jgi:hypothetical protein